MARDSRAQRRGAAARTPRGDASIEEIFAEQVRTGERVSAEPTADPASRARKVRCRTLSTRSCRVIGFGKLAPEALDLAQARLAIDALKALEPLLDEAPRRDIQQVIANLQLAYAGAATE